MHPDLERLLDLQAKDLALLEADTTVAEIMALEAALDERLARVERDAQAAGRALADMTARRDEVARRLEQFRGQQQKRQQRLDVVRNQREANAVTAEIDLGRQVVQREEQEFQRLGEEVQRLEARRAEAEQVLEEAGSRQQAERDELAGRRDEAIAVRNAALEVREASAAHLERALRTRYDRLRKAKSAPPVVPLVGYACSACFSAIPVSRRGEIRAGLLVEGCEACGVILYAPETTD
jgi:predicted  nucleic acid-binding Zn-ribbon protein